MGKITVVGTGPGAKEFLTPAAQTAIADAEIICGATRLLCTFADDHRQQLPIDKDLPAVIEKLREIYKQKRVVVLVSGDTGLFSFAQYLTKHFRREELEFIPGISSVQVMFARLQQSWADVRIISMHGRTEQGIYEIIKQTPVTAMVTGNPWTPQGIAEFLLTQDRTLTNWSVVIGKNLTYDDEQIVETSLGQLRNQQNDYSNSVMVIYNDTDKK